MPEPIAFQIADVAFGGNGVGRCEGKAVFVPFTIDGESITARIVKQKKNFAEARLLAIDTASPDRVEPRCPYFGRCGGCRYQHIRYAHQLEIKARQVEQTLRRIGRFAEIPMRPPVASPQDYEYRNRIRVHVADGVVGFYAFDRHELIDIERCPISSPAVNARLRELRSRALPEGDYALAERGEGEFFSQINDGAARLLVELVSGLLQPGHETLIDAYCGAGFFARQFAPRFKTVIGIEANEFAVARARHAAEPHESYLVGDVSSHLGEVLAQNDLAKTTLIFDPPATGLEARVIDFTLAQSPREIVYVSCNPATLARDLAALGGTYQLRSVTPLDMFPQTAEIEVVAHLLKST